MDTLVIFRIVQKEKENNKKDNYIYLLCMSDHYSHYFVILNFFPFLVSFQILIYYYFFLSFP